MRRDWGLVALSGGSGLEMPGWRHCGHGVAARKRRSTEGGGYREAKGDERLLNSFAGMKTNGMVALSS